MHTQTQPAWLRIPSSDHCYNSRIYLAPTWVIWYFCTTTPLVVNTLILQFALIFYFKNRIGKKMTICTRCHNLKRSTYYRITKRRFHPLDTDLLKPRYTCPNVPLPSNCPFFQREPGLDEFSDLPGLRGAEGVVNAE